MCVCAASVREPCIEAGLVKVLVPHLSSSDPEMLLNTGRAIGRICFDNCELIESQSSHTDYFWLIARFYLNI